MLIAGGKDEQVHYTQSVLMSVLLYGVGMDEVSLKLYKEETHVGCLGSESPPMLVLVRNADIGCRGQASCTKLATPLSSSTRLRTSSSTFPRLRSNFASGRPKVEDEGAGEGLVSGGLKGGSSVLFVHLPIDLFCRQSSSVSRALRLASSGG